MRKKNTPRVIRLNRSKAKSPEARTGRIRAKPMLWPAKVEAPIRADADDVQGELDWTQAIMALKFFFPAGPVPVVRDPESAACRFSPYTWCTA
jgi:hypothetical protein